MTDKSEKEDFNGIDKCAMCGGTPAFHIRMFNSYCNCTICGNGFIVNKGDYETRPANKSDKRFELIAMWNAKQESNRRLMESNDWRQEAYATDAITRSEIYSEVKCTEDAIKEISEIVKNNTIQVMEALEILVSQTAPAPVEDKAQTHIDDYVDKEETVEDVIVTVEVAEPQSVTITEAPAPIEFNPDVPEPAPAEDRFAAAIAAANASIAATPRKNLEVVSPVEDIPVEQLIEVMKEEPAKEEIPEFIIEPTECKPETEVLAVYAECENLAEESAKKNPVKEQPDVPEEVEEILKEAEEKPIEQAIEEKKLPDERDLETRMAAYDASSKVAYGLHTDATSEEMNEAFHDVMKEHAAPAPEEYKEAVQEKIEEVPAVFEEAQPEPAPAEDVKVEEPKAERPAAPNPFEGMSPDQVMQYLQSYLASAKKQ